MLNKTSMENALLFSQWKKQSLSRLDVSKKGSVDEDISHVVTLLNACENYFTTSSCSGRVIIIDGVSESTDVQKQNCVWLFVSHQKCQPEELVSSVSRASGDAVLKFEPFILHVQCRRLQDAQLLHSVAINSGFRNSGLTVGKTGKIIMAVRSTHGLEVPLSLQGNVLVGQDYIHFLVQVANQKMEENLKRIQRFYQSLHAALSVELRQELQIPDTRELQMPETENGDAAEERKEKSVYKRRRKRGQQQQSDEHCSPPELEDCMDLFTLDH